MPKQIKPSEQYLDQLIKLREKIRIGMLGNDPESQSELRNLEKKVIEKIIEVKRALGYKINKMV